MPNIRGATPCLVLLGLSTGACAADTPELRFEMFDRQDLQPFNDAWSTAASNPGESVRYTFPVVSVGLDERVEIRLLVGRSTNGEIPLVVDNDVVLADELALAITFPDVNGRAQFPTLAVAFDDAAPGTATIPWRYMCGHTVVVARAYGGAGGKRLAATWVGANPSCAIF